MKKVWLAIGITILTLAACASVSEVTPLPVETSTVTLRPTETSLPVPANTPLPTITRAPFEKPEGIYDQCLSPDGQWVAWSGQGLEVETLPHVIIEHVNGTSRWFVRQDNIEKYYLCSYSCYLDFVHWSTDGQIGYVAAHLPIDGPVFFGPYAGQIVRVELLTGEQEFLLSGEGAHAYGFSTDERLAYTSWDEGDVFTIVDLDSGETQKARLEFSDREQLGSIVWFPGQEGFLFSVLDPAAFSIWYFDLNTLAAEEIYQGKDCLGMFPEWVSEHELRYTCHEYSAEFSYLVLNIDTWEFFRVDE